MEKTRCNIYQKRFQNFKSFSLFQLPYYIPPVVLANLINLVFFVFLLFAVEVVPTLLGLLMRRQSKGPEDVLQSLQPTSKLVSVDQDVIRGGGIRCVCVH